MAGGFQKTAYMKQLEDDVYDTICFGSNQLNIKKSFDKDDITQLLCYRLHERYKVSDEFATQIGALLRRVSDSKDGYLQRYKEKGNIVRGQFCLRKKKTENKPISRKPKDVDGVIDMPAEPIITSNSHTTYLGKAGEMAVSSELLFRDFNVSLMAVDDGIDIVAIKHNMTFLIQVKTMSSHDGKTFSTHIRRGSFERYSNGNCFYVFVLRVKNESIYVVMASNEIEGNISKGCISCNPDRINLSFRLDKGKILIGSKEDVTYMKNRFDVIK